MGRSRTTALARRKRKPRWGKAARPPWKAWLAPLAHKRAPLVQRPLRGAKRPSWKLLGLAGLAGVAATGVVVARSRRSNDDLEPDELRARLHSRLEQVGDDALPPPATPPP